MALSAVSSFPPAFRLFPSGAYSLPFVYPDLLRDCFPCSFFGSFLLLSDFFPLALSHCLLCLPICFGIAFSAASSAVSSCFQTFSFWRFPTAFCAFRVVSDLHSCIFFGSFLLHSDLSDSGVFPYCPLCGQSCFGVALLWFFRQFPPGFRPDPFFFLGLSEIDCAFSAYRITWGLLSCSILGCFVLLSDFFPFFFVNSELLRGGFSADACVFFVCRFFPLPDHAALKCRQQAHQTASMRNCVSETRKTSQRDKSINTDQRQAGQAAFNSHLTLSYVERRGEALAILNWFLSQFKIAYTHIDGRRK
jgi:hypothetical protein